MDRGRPNAARGGSGGLFRRSTREDCSRSAFGPRRDTFVGCLLRARGRWRIGRQPVRPVLKHGPRSLTRARVAGLYETRGRNESERDLRIYRVGSRGLRSRAHHRPVSAATSARRSKSVRVGTRKMVNYA